MKHIETLMNTLETLNFIPVEKWEGCGKSKPVIHPDYWYQFTNGGTDIIEKGENIQITNEGVVYCQQIDYHAWCEVYEGDEEGFFMDDYGYIYETSENMDGVLEVLEVYTWELYEKLQESKEWEAKLETLRTLAKNGVEWLVWDAPVLGWEDNIIFGWYQALTDDEYKEMRKNEYEEYVEFQTKREETAKDYGEWLEAILDGDYCELLDIIINAIEEKIAELECDLMNKVLV